MDVPEIFIQIKDPDELSACWADFSDFYDCDEGREAKNRAWLNWQWAWTCGIRYAAQKAVTQ